TRVREGLRSINVLIDTFERWGDYTGIQRKYNENSVFWLSGNYGDNVNRTVIAKVSMGDISLSAGAAQSPRNFSLYPNPAQTYLEVLFDLSTTERVKFSIYDMQGREIKTLYHDRVKGGTNQFRFNTSAL